MITRKDIDSAPVQLQMMLQAAAAHKRCNIHLAPSAPITKPNLMAVTSPGSHSWRSEAPNSSIAADVIEH